MFRSFLTVLYFIQSSLSLNIVSTPYKESKLLVTLDKRDDYIRNFTNRFFITESIQIKVLKNVNEMHVFSP